MVDAEAICCKAVCASRVLSEQREGCWIQLRYGQVGVAMSCAAMAARHAVTDCAAHGPAAGTSLALDLAVLQVLTEMLDMLRDHQNNSHTARLEWIVIWLIVVEVIVGLFECASILGWVGTH